MDDDDLPSGEAPKLRFRIAWCRELAKNDLPAVEEARKLLFCITWRGPWERLTELFYGIRRDGTLRWEIPADPRGCRWLLGRAGDFCDSQDARWRRRHLARGTEPWPGWRRRGS